MGEPAVPTPKERAATRDLAASIIDAVRNDKKWPPGASIVQALSSRYQRMECEALVMQMAQEIVAIKTERDAVWSRLDNWDWRGLLRDAKRGDFTSVTDALRCVVVMDESREEALTAEMDAADEADAKGGSNG